ncbi:MAG: NAD-dependent epimerase/dehydratase family protein [Candidatus Zixiibacteriota bacterium]
MIKTILLTGSSGTVGTALSQVLIDHGYNLVPLDLRPSLWSDSIDRMTVRHDLRKPLNLGSLPRAKRKVDLIIHLAANARVHDSVLNPKLALDNYLMVYNLLELCRLQEIPRLLFTSSREIYGESRTGHRRGEEVTHIWKLKSPYTATKLGAEGLIHAYRECYGIKPVVARLSNVYGRYDVSERVIPLFLYYAKRHRDLNIYGPDKKLDFTFIDDTIDGLLRVVKRYDKAAGLTFNISRGQQERLVDLAEMIVSATGSRSQIVMGNKRTGEITSYVGSIELAGKMLGYNPTTSFDSGLEENIKWYYDAVRDRRVYAYQRRILAARGWA